MLKSIIFFFNVFLIVNYCLAASYNDFRKYGYIAQNNTLIERAIWGYKLRYTKKTLNTCAYVLAKVPQSKNTSSKMDKISFRFKARLYPVAPDTQDMRRVIKAYVKASLGVTKKRKHKNGVICTPTFVVCMNENLSSRKNFRRSFPIQYSKRSDKLPVLNNKKEYTTLLFKDTRLLPLNLFCNYDVEIIFDYSNKIVSFNCNDNKVILRNNFMNVWKYFGLSTIFSAIGSNKNTIIALEYEFTNFKICRNTDRANRKKKETAFPRFDCAYYQELIKRKKDIDAMYCLGMNYYEGYGGVEKDYYQAFKWFKKAALKKHVFGQYYLGLCYLYGLGVGQDNLRAWKWLSRSGKYFYDKAQVLAAQCIIDNVKTTNELKKAKLLQSFLGPAFFQGNANACFLQSYCAYYDITKTKISYLEGFEDAARRGHPKAFYYLGMYFAKKGRTLGNAYKCYLKAAELGFIPAFVKLGMCYQEGSGTKGDSKEAFVWFQKAAHENNAEGIFRLACCYLLGKGVEKDKKQAIKLFISAAEKNSPRALIALLFLQENDSESQFFYGNDKAATINPRTKRTAVT